MIRRVLATVLAAFVIVAAPVAAQAASAYPAPDPTLTCSTAQVAPGTAFTCTVTGEEGATAVLQATFDGDDPTIAGTVTSPPRTITNGEAVFNLTAPAITGVIQLSATVNGVTVQAEAAVDVVDELSGTGFDGAPLAIGAAVLLVAGAAIVFVAARRRSKDRAEQTV